MRDPSLQPSPPALRRSPIRARTALGRIALVALLFCCASVFSTSVVHAQDITYEVTVDSIRPYRTRGPVDRDFLLLTLSEVKDAQPQVLISSPKTVGQLFADNVQGDGQLHPSPMTADGNPVFRLSSWVNTEKESLVLGYSLVDLNRDTYMTSLEKFHNAVRAIYGTIYSGSASVLNLVGDSFDAALVGVLGVVTGALEEGFAWLIGLDDPRTYNCDGVVLADTLTLSGKQLFDMTENPTHSFQLNDIRLLQLSHSNGITSTEHGSGYMGIGDASSKCGSRSLYDINVIVRRIATASPTPAFVNQLSQCDAKTLQPADSAPRAEWNGTWSDPLQRIKVGVQGRGYLIPNAGFAWRYKVNSSEGESAYGRLSRVITETVDAATLSNTMTVTRSLDQYCCTSQLIKGVVVGSVPTKGRSAVSHVRTTQAIALPDNIQLQLFQGCLASAARSEKFHLRYLRTDTDGRILTDVLLSRSQAPPK